MANNIFFMHRIKRANDTFDKGIEVKNTGATSDENFEAAKQAYHAYLGAYAYNHDANTDFVSCMITDMTGKVIEPFDETWQKVVPEPEPEPEET